MPMLKLKQYLDDHRVKYVTIHHSPAFTAQEIAASAHIPGRSLAKTVMVKLDHAMAMVVLPASEMVDFDRLRRLTGAKQVEIATEQEFRDMFPGCEPGAMPPFGNLYGMKVFASMDLGNARQIVFNAGSHRELIRLSYVDFVHLVRPTLAHLVADEALTTAR
jgi:Ala-tRNA(Pro) deacylase